MACEALADCGNTAVKLACLADGGIDEVLVMTGDAADLASWAHAHGGAGRLTLVPGSRPLAACVRAAWQEAGGSVQELGVDIPAPEVDGYPGLGLDRILAGIAAVRAHGAAVVVDAGTAVTVDAWMPAASAAGARFLGGLIAPGARACVDGLCLAAPALPIVPPGEADAAALQRDTAGALAAAVGIGHPALVAACHERVRAVSGIDTTVLSGGGAEALLPALGTVLRHPHLVLDGLAWWVRAAR